LLAFPRVLRLDCHGRDATLSWRRAELDPAILDAGCEIVAGVCKPG
jgi:hypothetical protein